MILNGKEYSNRLASFSNSTARLISELMTKRITAEKSLDIVSNSVLSEEEVVAKLQELKNTYLKSKKAK